MEGFPRRELKNRRGAAIYVDFLSPRCVIVEQNDDDDDDGDKKGSFVSAAAAAADFQDKENE